MSLDSRVNTCVIINEHHGTCFRHVATIVPGPSVAIHIMQDRLYSRCAFCCFHIHSKGFSSCWFQIQVATSYRCKLSSHVNIGPRPVRGFLMHNPDPLTTHSLIGINEERYSRWWGIAYFCYRLLRASTSTASPRGRPFQVWTDFYL